jgi:uncharacterized protein (DUF433 family)
MNIHDIPAPLQQYFDQSPGVLAGKLRIRGTRVSVEQILELIEAGVTSPEIVGSHPSLTEQDVGAVERLAAHCARHILQLA